MELYHQLGLSGAIGSTDVTHVKWDRCPYSLQRSYSEKEGHPTIAYMATVDFTGRLLGTTRGFPGSAKCQDHTPLRSCVQRIREDRQYTEQVFELKSADGKAVKHKGNYLIVDNGYHKVCPIDKRERNDCPIFSRCQRAGISVPIVGITRACGRNASHVFE